MANFSKVSLLDAELRLPGLGSLAAFGPAYLAHSHPPLTAVAVRGNHAQLELGSVQISPESPHYPRRSDLKTLRSESIAAVDCAGELLARRAPTESERHDMSLYASTSISVGQNPADIAEIFRLVGEHAHSSEEARNRQLLADLHPLFGLRALTNAAESVIAQTYGLRGENATFGDTPLAGYFAMLEAAFDIEEERAPLALAMGTHCSGLYSAIAWESFAGPTLRESTAAAGLFLGPDAGSWRLVEAADFPASQARMRLPGADWAVSTSAFDEKTWADNSTLLAGYARECFLPFSLWGSCGSASFEVSVALGQQLAKRNGARSLLVYESDVFGQAAYVKLVREDVR